MKKETKQKYLRNCGWIGIAAVIFYFLHVIVGNLLYNGYNPITQAISDLTANGSPSEVAAGIISRFYGVFDLAFRITFYLYFRKKISKIFTAGALTFLIMSIVSNIGYTAFPLSEVGTTMNFQNIMHVIVTALVVVSSIVALVLIAIGFIKKKQNLTLGILAIITLFLMMLGSILTGSAPAILGIAERLSIYSLQIYSLLLAIYMIKYKDTNQQESI